MEAGEDAQNHRVGKQLSGTLQKQYLWSSTLRIAAELDGTGNVTSRFIYGHKVNVPALIVQPNAGGDKLYRVITDQLGSPTYVVNIANPADVLLDAKYDEWGKVTAYTSSTGAWPIPFGFAGGLYDEDTGLVRFGARDYDPTVGRWTNKDPIRWEGGQANLYVYVGNDPVNRADPRGLLPWIEVALPWLAAQDAANWAGAATTIANILTPGASTSLSWNGGNPIVVLENSPWTFGNAGLTLGHVVALQNETATSMATYRHELAHVEQHDILGPAYLPLHALTKVFCYAFSANPTQCDPLERGPYESPPCPF